MHLAFLASFLAVIAGLASAAPTPTSTPQDQYYGVSVGVVVSPGTDSTKVVEPVPVELNVLALCGGGDDVCAVSELIVQNGTASAGLGIDSIECRGYKDAAGVVPGSAPFNVSAPALVSTNLATISSILCYVVEV